MKWLKMGAISLVASLTMVGCGGGGGDDAQSGYFVDAPVANLEYNTSSGLNGMTDMYGRFDYINGDSVSFGIGKLTLGSCLPAADGLVTPAQLTDSNETLTLMLQLLQALDVDNNVSNGIVIPEDIVDSLNEESSYTSLSDLNETTLLDNKALATKIDANYDGVIDVNQSEATAHFQDSMEQWKSENKFGSIDINQGNSTQNGYYVDVSTYPTSTLTQELKDYIAHMGNEERLAHDVYLNLYNYHKENSGLEIKQLTNIATKSESQHIEIVKSLAKKYTLNINYPSDVNSTVVDEYGAENLPMGVYDIPAIQSLYDVLYAKGTQSQKDALETGCMVEVTDINDLDNYTTIAEEFNATDVVEAFKVLRNGSYNHYWAFDAGLKNIGVSEGCCSLGVIDGVDYCHNEYPNN